MTKVALALPRTVLSTSDRNRHTYLVFAIFKHQRNLGKVLIPTEKDPKRYLFHEKYEKDNNEDTVIQLIRISTPQTSVEIVSHF